MYQSEKQSGFVILFAVVVSALLVLLMSGVYGQAIRETALSSTARQSLLAFYAADSAMECALYDQFRDNGLDDQLDCYGRNNLDAGTTSPYWQFAIYPDTASNVGQVCAEIIVRSGVPNGGFDSTTEVITRGFNSCDNESPLFRDPNLVERRLRAWYPNG